MVSDLIFTGDRLAPFSQIRISPFNTALFYGESLFETLPVYYGKPLFLQEHLARLEKGCRFLDWPIPPGKTFEKAVRLFAGQTGGHFAIRFCLVQEVDPPANPRRFSKKKPRLFAVIRPLRHHPESFIPPLGRAGVSPWTVPSPGSVPGEFKWIFYMMIRHDFRKHPEWDEMLRLNEKGYAVDGGSSAPLWAADDVVYAPPLSQGGLESVTRLKVLELCRALRIPVKEKAWKPSDVLKRGELFFAGSGVGIQAITHLMGKRLKGSNTLALRLWQHYRSWALTNEKY